MTTQFKIFPCRAKGTAPVRSGRAARQPACAFRRKARAASRKTPQIASSQPRPPGAGPLSARAGRKIANTANSPMEGRAEPRHFPHTAAVCRPPRTLRASVPRASHTRATRPVSFAHRRAAREAKAAHTPCTGARSPGSSARRRRHRSPAHAPRPAHFTRQRPACLTHPRRASRGLRPQARRT